MWARSRAKLVSHLNLKKTNELDVKLNERSLYNFLKETDDLSIVIYLVVTRVSTIKL